MSLHPGGGVGVGVGVPTGGVGVEVGVGVGVSTTSSYISSDNSQVWEVSLLVVIVAMLSILFPEGLLTTLTLNSYSQILEGRSRFPLPPGVSFLAVNTLHSTLVRAKNPLCFSQMRSERTLAGAAGGVRPVPSVVPSYLLVPESYSKVVGDVGRVTLLSDP